MPENLPAEQVLWPRSALAMRGQSRRGHKKHKDSLNKFIKYLIFMQLQKQKHPNILALILIVLPIVMAN